MFDPCKGNRQDDPSARTQHTPKFRQQLLGIENMFQHLIQHDSVEGLRVERQRLTVIKVIGVPGLPGSRSIDFHADISGTGGKKFLVRPGSATDVQNPPFQLRGQLFHHPGNAMPGKIEMIQKNSGRTGTESLPENQLLQNLQHRLLPPNGIKKLPVLERFLPPSDLAAHCRNNTPQSVGNNSRRTAASIRIPARSIRNAASAVSHSGKHISRDSGQFPGRNRNGQTGKPLKKQAGLTPTRWCPGASR